jgi:steroid delta-isomerase-like uncharacterized protein
MTREDIQTLFARREQAWRDRDAASLASSHAEHGTVASPMFTNVVGRQDILEAYRSLFRIFPDWTLTGQDLIIDGDRVAQHFIATATQAGEFMGLAGTGRRFNIEGVLLFRVENGLIADERRIYDFTGLLVQIGVMRMKPAKQP